MQVATPRGVLSWWWKQEVFWLLLLVALGYGFRLQAPSVRGEESRRGMIAAEMVQSGDWITPRLQGEPWLSRPPLQYWLIALTSWLHGECDTLAIRLPSVLAILLTTLLIYAYGRTFLSTLGAFAAALAFASMVEVLKIGRLAETEAIFTLFLGGALLVWHWGHSRRWPELTLWLLSYSLVALAALAKGIQAPVYFLGPITVFLWLTGQGRRLVSRAHLAGLLLFAALFSLWLIPFFQEFGWDGVRTVLWETAAERYHAGSSAALLRHLFGFPLEVFACLLPWSLLLLVYTRRPFRESLGTASDAVLFLFTCLAVTFPSLWLALGARSRYWLPLYPCVAPLVGLAVERCLTAAADSPLRIYWKRFTCLCALGGLGLLILAVAGTPLEEWTGWPLRQPPLASLGLVLALSALLLLFWRERTGDTPARARLALLSLAGVLVVSHSVWFLNILIAHSVATERAVVQVRDQIGAEGQLVSLDHVHHLFAFYYQQPIPRLPWPEKGDALPPTATHFCFARHRSQTTRPLPFAWEKLAVVNCDRNVREQPEWVVVVGRRLPAGTAQVKKK